MKIEIISGLTLLACASFAQAEPYVGFQVGTLDYDLPNFDDPTSIEVYVGSRLNENLAVELNYVDFGESEDGIPPVWTLSGSTFGVGAKFFVPVADGIDLYGRLGVHTWEVELKEAGFGQLAKDDGTDIFYGMGMNFDLSENISLGANYAIFQMDEEDASILSAVMQVNFR